MRKQLWKRNTLRGCYHQHALYQILSFSRDRHWELDIHLHLSLVKSFHSWCFKRNCSLQHDIQQNSKWPYIHIKVRIFTVSGHFRGQVGRCSALLLYNFVLSNESWNPEVTEFDSTFAIKKDIVQLNISMQNRPAVTVGNPLRYLLENVLGLIFWQGVRLPHQMVQITASGILHNHHNMLFVLKNLEQPYNIGMPDFLENIDFLEHLLSRILIFELR